MTRFDLTEDTWTKYTAMMTWLRDNYGECEGWNSEWFQPKKLKGDTMWYMGVHRMKWYSSHKRICVWMPDDVYTAFILRFA